MVKGISGYDNISITRCEIRELFSPGTAPGAPFPTTFGYITPTNNTLKNEAENEMSDKTTGRLCYGMQKQFMYNERILPAFEVLQYPPYM